MGQHSWTKVNQHDRGDPPIDGKYARSKEIGARTLVVEAHHQTRPTLPAYHETWPRKPGDQLNTYAVVPSTDAPGAAHVPITTSKVNSTPSSTG